MKTGQENAPCKAQNRIFSEDFKKQKVKELDEKLISICELVNLYSVSRTSIYKWMAKYSVHYQQGTKMVVQMESESNKKNKSFSVKQSLNALLDNEQMEIDFLNKLIEISSQELKIDLRKNFSYVPSNGFPAIEGNILGK